jgi:superfamily II DNA or RNA helicase
MTYRLNVSFQDALRNAHRTASRNRGPSRRSRRNPYGPLGDDEVEVLRDYMTKANQDADAMLRDLDATLESLQESGVLASLSDDDLLDEVFALLEDLEASGEYALAPEDIVQEPTFEEVEEEAPIVGQRPPSGEVVSMTTVPGQPNEEVVFFNTDQAQRQLIKMIEILFNQPHTRIQDLRSNPHARIHVPRRLRHNPFLPEDQQPLLMFYRRARIDPSLVHPADWVKAAHLLIKHQDDFHIADILGVLRALEMDAASEGHDIERLPVGATKPLTQDYLIVSPNNGSVREKGQTFDWEWKNGASAFKFSFSPEAFPNAGGDLLKSLKMEGYVVRPASEVTGMHRKKGLVCSLNTAPPLVEALKSQGYPAAAAHLQVAAIEWARSNPGAYAAPPLSEEDRKKLILTPDDENKLRTYLESLVEEYGAPDDIYEHMSQGDKYASLRVLEAVRGGVDTVILYPSFVTKPPGRMGVTEIVLPRSANNNAGMWERKRTKVWVWNADPQFRDLGAEVDDRRKRQLAQWPRQIDDYGSDARHQKADHSHSTLGERYWQEPASIFSDEAIHRFEGDSEGHWVAKLRARIYANTGNIVLSGLDGYFYTFPISDMLTNDYTSSYYGKQAIKMLASKPALAISLIRALSGLEDSDTACPNLYEISSGTRIEPETFQGVYLDGIVPPVSPDAPSEVQAKTQALELLRESVLGCLPDENFKAVKQIASAEIGGKVETKIFRPLKYQEIGIAFIHLSGCRALIGDEMGLGKTIQALGALAVDPSPITGQRMLPALVIAPASVLGSWKNEVNTWLPHLTVKIDTNPNSTPLGPGGLPDTDITVLSWGQVGRHAQRYTGKFQTVIVDEAHYGKRLFANRKKAKATTYAEIVEGSIQRGKLSPYVQRTFGEIQILHSVPHAIMLTGTPLENGKAFSELWAPLYGLNPIDFPNMEGFQAKYKDLMRMEGKDANEMFAALKDDLKCYMCRRIKQEVADQTKLGRLILPDGTTIKVGPDKEITTANIEPTAEQRAIYDRQASDSGLYAIVVRSIKRRRLQLALLHIEKGNDPYEGIQIANSVDWSPADVLKVGLATTNYLRQAAGEMKVPSAIQFINRKVGTEGKALLVWYKFKKVGDAMQTALDTMQVMDRSTGQMRPVRYARFHGATPSHKRTEIVDAFQKGIIDVIVASTAMREGVTLTRANEALFIERWYVPSWMNQAEDRIYRIGQTRDVTITYLHAPDTTDDGMLANSDQKRAVIDAVIGSDKFLEESDDDKLEAQIAQIVAKDMLEKVEALVRKFSTDAFITVEDLKEAIAEAGLTIESATLKGKYASPGILDDVVQSLKSPEDALTALRAVEDDEDAKFSKIEQSVLDYLEAQGESVSLVKLYNHFQKGKKGKGNQALKVLDSFADMGIVKMPVPDEFLSPIISRGKEYRGRRLVRFLQSKGGGETTEQIRRLLKIDQNFLSKMASHGVIELEDAPIVRLNPRLRANLNKLFGGNLPGAGTRTRANRKRKRSRSNPLEATHRKLVTALKGRMTGAKSDAAHSAYIELSHLVEEADRHGRHVPDSYALTLDKAYAILTSR